MAALQCGYKVIHKKFGNGIVTAIGQHVEVDFESVGRKILQIEWVKENCTIIVPREDKEALDRGYWCLCKIMDQVVEDKLQEIVEKFERFNLTDYGMKQIENFFRFKLNYEQGHRRELRYNLLIQCENDTEAVAFIKEIQKGLKKIGVLPKGAVIKNEASLVDDIPSEFPSECSLFAIHNGMAIMKDSVSIVSSAIRARLQVQRESKDKLWRNIKELSEAKPDCTIIAVGSKGFVNYMRESDEMYYRFFAHRIFIQPMSVAEIISAVYKEIKKEQISTTKEFRTEIEKYIQVVYPKADLRDTAFVNDLLNRIMISYFLYAHGGRMNEDCVPYYRKPKSYEEISDKLNQLVGLGAVKKQFKNIYHLSQDELNVNKQRLHFAFVGNPGTGKTTVAKLTAELLYSMGLIKKNKLVVVAPTDVISIYKGESGQLMREKIEEAMGGVLFIDEAYFLTSSTAENNSPQKQCLEVLIQSMENHSDELSVIFAGYEEEMENMLKSNVGIASRVPFKFVFEDYSDEELLRIFLHLAKQEDMRLEEDAYKILGDRIALAKTEENFGNARTIANIYQQLKSVWVEKGRPERVITAQDIKETMPKVLHTNLDDMIGLETVKQELKIFESRMKYIKHLQSKEMSIASPNMHMMFTGNPGTGKTTVAKKIADCLYSIGVLKTNKLVVAERKDLIDPFVGGTAIKTNKLIQKAMNGVLFIDEAYSLYRMDDSKDYGTEAIATLITAMEEYKGKLVIILAGYKKEMQNFQSSNPGIASRIGFTFHFPDYTPVELTQIFYEKMKKSGFIVNGASLDAVLKVMEYFSKMNNFGNGRFVDKVIDMTISNRSKRSYSKRYNDITVKDIPEIGDLIAIHANGQELWTDEEQSDSLRKRVAIHEAGHAVVSQIIDSNRKVKMVSIHATADSVGKAIVEHDQDGDTESSMKAQLAILFAGRNAERLVLGDHSAGCISDISQAKKIAAYMIEQLAMGDFGETTAMELLKEADKKATKILTEKKEQLIKIADVLFEKGTILGDELDELLKDSVV